MAQMHFNDLDTWHAVGKYLHLRRRSYSSAMSEKNLVWMIDADRALASLSVLDRNILFARCHGFSAQLTAKLLHTSRSTIERGVHRAASNARAAFVSRKIITEIAPNEAAQ